MFFRSFKKVVLPNRAASNIFNLGAPRRVLSWALDKYSEIPAAETILGYFQKNGCKIVCDKQDFLVEKAQKKNISIVPIKLSPGVYVPVVLKKVSFPGISPAPSNAIAVPRLITWFNDRPNMNLNRRARVSISNGLKSASRIKHLDEIEYDFTNLFLVNPFSDIDTIEEVDGGSAGLAAGLSVLPIKNRYVYAATGVVTDSNKGALALVEHIKEKANAVFEELPKLKYFLVPTPLPIIDNKYKKDIESISGQYGRGRIVCVDSLEDAYSFCEHRTRHKINSFSLCFRRYPYRVLALFVFIVAAMIAATAIYYTSIAFSEREKKVELSQKSEAAAHAKAIIEEIKRKVEEQKKNEAEARLLNKKAEILIEQGRYGDAAYVYRKSLALSELLETKMGAIQVVNNTFPQIANFYGHNDRISSLAFSPNGKYLASVDYRGNVVVRKISTGKVVANYREESVDNVPWLQGLKIAFSPDGNILACVCTDDRITIRDAFTGRLIRIIGAGETKQFTWVKVPTLAFSPDGKIVASGRSNGTVGFWSVKDGEKTAEIGSGRLKTNSIEYSADGNILGVGSERDESVILYSTKTLSSVRTYHSNGTVFDFSKKNGELLLDNDTEDRIDIRLLEDNALRGDIERNPGYADLLETSFDGEFVARKNLTEEEIQILSLKRGVLIQILRSHDRPITSIAFSPTENILATGNLLGEVILWSLEKYSEVKSLDGIFCDNTRKAFWGKDKIVLCKIENSASKLFIYNKENGTKENEIILGNRNIDVEGITFSADGTLMGIAKDKSIEIYSNEAEVIQSIQINRKIKRVLLSQKGEAIATLDRDGTVEIYSTERGEKIKKAESIGFDKFRSMIECPNDNCYILINEEGRARIEYYGEMINGDVFNDIKDETDISEIAFGREGKTVAISKKQKGNVVWRKYEGGVRTGTIERSIEKITFDEDNNYLWGIDEETKNGLVISIESGNIIEFGTETNWQEYINGNDIVVLSSRGNDTTAVYRWAKEGKEDVENKVKNLIECGLDYRITGIDGIEDSEKDQLAVGRAFALIRNEKWYRSKDSNRDCLKRALIELSENYWESSENDCSKNVLETCGCLLGDYLNDRSFTDEFSFMDLAKINYAIGKVEKANELYYLATWRERDEKTKVMRIKEQVGILGKVGRRKDALSIVEGYIKEKWATQNLQELIIEKARVLSDMGENEKAISYLKQEKDIFDIDNITFPAFGIGNSIVYLPEAITTRGDKDDYHIEMGWLQHLAGNVEEAIKELSLVFRTTEDKEEKASARYRIAAIEIDNKEYEEAIENINEALRIEEIKKNDPITFIEEIGRKMKSEKDILSLRRTEDIENSRIEEIEGRTIYEYIQYIDMEKVYSEGMEYGATIGAIDLYEGLAKKNKAYYYPLVKMMFAMTANNLGILDNKDKIEKYLEILVNSEEEDVPRVWQDASIEIQKELDSLPTTEKVIELLAEMNDE